MVADAQQVLGWDDCTLHFSHNAVHVKRWALLSFRPQAVAQNPWSELLEITAQPHRSFSCQAEEMPLPPA